MVESEVSMSCMICCVALWYVLHEKMYANFSSMTRGNRMFYVHVVE